MRRVLPFGFGFGATALLAWLYVQTRAADPVAWADTVERVQDLQAMDARLDRLVLQARLGALEDFDPIVGRSPPRGRSWRSSRRGPGIRPSSRRSGARARRWT